MVKVENQIKNNRGKKLYPVDINLASLAERFNGKKVRITIQEVKEKKVVKKKESKNNAVDKQTAGWIDVIKKGR